jgi:hypothetical protein
MYVQVKKIPSKKKAFLKKLDHLEKRKKQKCKKQDLEPILRLVNLQLHTTSALQ